MNKSAPSFTLLVAFLGLSLLGTAAFYSNEIDVWWAYHAHAASIDKALGFKCGLVKAQFPVMKTPEEVFAIVSVRPGGIAESAGFRAGDIPVNISPCVCFLPPHGALYARVRNGRGTTIKVPVINCADVGPGWFERIRIIDLPTPRD